MPLLQLISELVGNDRSVDFLVVKEYHGGEAASHHTTHGDRGEEVRFCVIGSKSRQTYGLGLLEHVSLVLVERFPRVMNPWKEDPVVEFPDVAFRHVHVVTEFSGK